jgi:hypothetical protein
MNLAGETPEKRMDAERRRLPTGLFFSLGWLCHILEKPQVLQD